MEGLFGLISNTMSTSFVHPIDVVKSNYQMARNTSNPQSVKQIMRSTWNTNGLRGFYRGLGPNLGTYPIFWGVYFQTGKHKVNLFQNKYLDKFTTSFAAGNIASAVANPLFVVKTRLQTNNNNKGYIQTMKDINRSGGTRAFFRGLPSTMLNNFKLGIQFPMYDYFLEKTNNIAISSASAKLISSTALYPLDLVRVIQRGSEKKLPIKKIARNIYAKEGIRGLYRGALLYNCVSTPNFVIMMMMLEFLRSNFSDKV